MRRLLDQGVASSAAGLLRNRGLAVVHAGEFGLASASDEEIIAHAVSNGYCIGTLDADVHSLVAAQAARGPSVVRLRMQGLKAPDIVRVLVDVLARLTDELERGSLVTVTAQAIRFRRLPIVARPGTCHGGPV